jgi:hypothetical protein
MMIDERYYFSSLAPARQFYPGWKAREFTDDDDQPCGLDHSGLYSSGRLIHGQSVHGDVPRHEGEGLREILEQYARLWEEDAER